MPFDAYGNEIPSHANKKTGLITFGDIGGVGQLVYHNFRYADYQLEYDKHDKLIAVPVINREMPPDLEQREDLDGKEILTSLCNLAQEIDSYETKEEFLSLIIQWCKTNIHPYRIDTLFEVLSKKDFDTHEVYARIAVQDGVFSIDDFLKELGNLYNAARFRIALDGVLLADEQAAYNLYHEGRFFESSQLFEQYKRHLPQLPSDFDMSASDSDLIKEMQLENKYLAEHPVEQPEDGGFAYEPYDDYESLRDKMLDFFPDFKLRLKVSPKTQRVVLSAEVDSVFDIAWYALAHLITEEPLPEEKGKQISRPEGIMTYCRNCGQFFIRRNSRNEYCDRIECQKARNAKNQREFRDRQKKIRCMVKSKK